MWSFARKKGKKSDLELDREFDSWAANGVAKATKFWFELMQWIVFIGALHFLRTKTPNPMIHGLYWISMCFLVAFIEISLFAYFRRFAKTTWQRRALTVVALIVSIVCGFILVILLDDLGILV